MKTKITFLFLVATFLTITATGQKRTEKNTPLIAANGLETYENTDKKAPANVIYVSKQNGNNKNDGSKSAPLKNLDKAIEVSQSGGTIFITGGVEMGTLNIGFIESDKPVQIFGSWDEGFTKQDIKAHPTLIQPDNESARSSRKSLMEFTKDVKGTVIDHLIFDGGQRNAYHLSEGVVEGIVGGRLLSDTEKPPVGNSTVYEPLLQFVSATNGGDVTVQNCVFVNGASFALQAGHRSGKFTVKNNLFIANRMAAIEIYGTCASTGGPNTMTLCGSVEIAFNTILFSWSRNKDFQDMGYGVRVMTKCDYNIHHNIIGASILAGVDHTRFNKNEWVKVDNNIFFVNKDKDLHYSPSSNTLLRIDAGNFGDLEIASAKGNRNEIPKELKIKKQYYDGFINVRTMFSNRYPWNESLDLFGNVSGYGAQNINSLTSAIKNPENNFNVYPNPVNGHLIISGLNNRNKFEIISSSGIIIATRNSPGETERIDFSELQNGIYILRIWENNDFSIFKILKK